ncbi:MAG: dihydroneopterin aldolase [Pseudomonadota bacterium]
MKSTIELTDLALPVSLGTYGAGDVVPDTHLLDLTLSIDPGLVFIDADAMEHVFDYDPLVAEIDRLARDGHYHTQERLMTRIVEACAAHREIEAVEIGLRKRPVLNESGALGVRLRISAEDMRSLRQTRGAG